MDGRKKPNRHTISCCSLTASPRPRTHGVQRINQSVSAHKQCVCGCERDAKTKYICSQCIICDGWHRLRAPVKQPPSSLLNGWTHSHAHADHMGAPRKTHAGRQAGRNKRHSPPLRHHVNPHPMKPASNQPTKPPKPSISQSMERASSACRRQRLPLRPQPHRRRRPYCRQATRSPQPHAGRPARPSRGPDQSWMAPRPLQQEVRWWRVH